MAINLTRDGFEKLQNEMTYLKTVRRREVAEALDIARQKADLRENAEYDAAKDEQAHLEARLAELEKTLADVRIIDDEDIDDSKAYLGAYVTVLDVDRDKEVTYMLVSKEEANLQEKKISIDSPIGGAILGKEVGDEVTVEVPARTISYKILKIER